ncbi:cysteine-rich receptor-like protein kinase 8, partial [Tanacetum coccineum]
MPNTSNSMFTSQRPTQTRFERKSSFRKGVYCGNCGKEGHLQEECYKIVGYPIGHPFHGKVQPTKQFKATNAVNMVMTQDQVPQDKASTSGKATAPLEDHVSVRMDKLQNKLNQVLFMLQQNGSHVIFSSKSTCLPKFTATLITCLQVAWIIDSGATDHICIALKLMHNIYKCKTPITVNLSNGQTDQSKRIALGNLCDGLYFFSSPPKISATTSTIIHSSSKSQLWHLRLGHLSFTVLKKIKTFAPVAKMVSVRALLVLSVHHNWFIEKLDINNAFLHEDTHEEVYMTIPQGYSKQLPPNFLLVYVDDILLTGNHQYTINLIKKQLHKKFSIKDLGPIHYYLGIEILRNSHGLVMSQRKYALELLK